MSDAALRVALEVADWRRRVAELYAAVRAAEDPAEAWAGWCAVRTALYRDHPQSPLPPDRRAADDLPRFHPYDPGLRLLAEAVPADDDGAGLPASSGVAPAAVRVAVLVGALADTVVRLPMYRLTDYAGGLLVAVVDATAGTTSYGGGRYLLDTAKGADLGLSGDRVILDFNFLFHPSCVHDPRWNCPLAGPDARLPVAIAGGERFSPAMEASLSAHGVHA